MPAQHHALDWLARRHAGESAALIAFGKIFYFPDVEDGLRAYDDVLRFS